MSGSDFLATLPLLIVVGWAIVMLIVDLFVPRDRKQITALLSAAGMAAALVVVLIQLYDETQHAFGGMLVRDGFAGFMMIIFIVAGLLGIALANDYLKRREIERGEYYILLLFTLGGMMLMAMAGDLIIVFLGLELLSLPLYVLSGFARPEPASEEGALKYFLLGAFATSFVVYGIAFVYGAAATTNLSDIFIAGYQGTANQGLLLLGAALLLVGLGFKIAVVPFHMWTPDVYQGAPSSVTAFMSVGAKAGGFAALLRVFLAAFPGLAASWAPLVMWIAAFTMVWGNVAAISQKNIKRMLAYSSIAHAGYILMVLPAASSPGVGADALSAALFYLLAYAVSNLGAWGVVIALERKEAKGLLLEDYAGLGTRRPGFALAMLLFMLSLIGLPPTAGFMGKFYIFRAVIDADMIWLALVGVATSVISAYYYLRVVIVMYMQAGEPESRSEGWLNSTVGFTALATLLLGILPGPVLMAVRHALLGPGN